MFTPVVFTSVFLTPRVVRVVRVLRVVLDLTSQAMLWILFYHANREVSGF